ncbi:MAG: outer membrane beta-barrel protein [Calditrichota bacterium]
MRALFGFVCVVFFSLPAFSQVGFGPQVGYFKSADADEGNFMPGGVIRVQLSSALTAEASINYRQEEYGEGIVTVKSWPVMVSGLLYPLPIAYGLIGAGWYNTTFDYDEEKLSSLPATPEDVTEQEFGWHAGAGIELPFGSNSRIFADFRYVFLNYDFSEIPDNFSSDSDFFLFNVGLVLGM